MPFPNFNAQITFCSSYASRSPCPENSYVENFSPSPANEIIHLNASFVSWPYLNDLFFKYLQPQPKYHWLSAVGEGNILWSIPFPELYYTCCHQYNPTSMKKIQLNKKTNQPNPNKKPCCPGQVNEKESSNKNSNFRNLWLRMDLLGKEDLTHMVKTTIDVILHSNLFFKSFFFRCGVSVGTFSNIKCLWM